VNAVLLVQFSLLSLSHDPETIHLSFNLLFVDGCNSVRLSVDSIACIQFSVQRAF